MRVPLVKIIETFVYLFRMSAIFLVSSKHNFEIEDYVWPILYTWEKNFFLTKVYNQIENPFTSWGAMV